eukprot:360291-Chlamydomonas_euryale.AAC.13
MSRVPHVDRALQHLQLCCSFFECIAQSGARRMPVGRCPLPGVSSGRKARPAGTREREPGTWP